MILWAFTLSLALTTASAAQEPFPGRTVYGPIKVWHVGIVLSVVYFAYTRLFASSPGRKVKKVEASHILVKSEALALELKGQIMLDSDSTTFADLAKQHSTCPSGKTGGSLGSFSPGQMVPAFDKVCWEAPVGVVQGPVQTQYGYHLILVTHRTDPGNKVTKTE